MGDVGWSDPRCTHTRRGERTNFEQADNGERRTTQVLQLDTAEQTAEQFQVLSQLGETRGRSTGHEFLACRSKIAADLKIRNCSMQEPRRTMPESCGRASANAIVGLL
jgi:hypothetical protein